MYLKDKTYDLHIRLNERQYNFLKWTSENYKVEISKFVRILIDAAQAIKTKGEEKENENIKTDINDII